MLQLQYIGLMGSMGASRVLVVHCGRSRAAWGKAIGSQNDKRYPKSISLLAESIPT